MAVNNLNTPGVGIQPSIVDAKGDLIAGTAADAVGRLAVGTNGQQLVADSTASTGLKWDNPSGLVHIEQQAVGAVSALNFNNVFSSDYKSYFITGRMVHSASEQTVQLRFRNAGSDRTANEYKFQQLDIFNTTFNNGANTGTNFAFHRIDTNEGGSFELYIFNPFESDFTSFMSVAGCRGRLRVSTGGYNVSQSQDGFSLISGSGNFASGFINVYGLRD